MIFGWPEEWGSVGDLKDDIDWAEDVYPIIMSDIYGWRSPYNPVGYGKAEFFRLFLGLSPQQFYNQGGWGLPMWFVLMVGANLEQRAGGNPLQNLDAKEFILPSGNVTYLSGLLGGNAQLLINEINDTKIGASPSARNYLEHYATFTGKIKHPVIQLHSAYDTMAHVAGTGL